MNAKLSPQELDRRAALAVDGAADTPEHPRQLWLWMLSGIIVLLAFASGGAAGFLSGRLYERAHAVTSFEPAEWWLGASLADRENGVFIDRVYERGAAYSTGLQSGDRLVSIGGEPTNFSKDVRTLLELYSPGETVLITIERGHRFSQYGLILGGISPYSETITTIQPVVINPIAPASTQEARLGVYYRMLKADDTFAVTQGAMIISLLSDETPAAQAGLRPGDIITQVNGQPLTEAYPLESALSSIAQGKQMRIMVNRAGDAFTIIIELDH